MLKSLGNLIKKIIDFKGLVILASSEPEQSPGLLSM